MYKPVCSANAYFQFGFDVSRNLLNHKILRFNPIQAAEWLRELMAEDTPTERRRVAKEVGISRPRIYQFLDLLKLPARDRVRYRRNSDLREYHLRGFLHAS